MFDLTDNELWILQLFDIIYSPLRKTLPEYEVHFAPHPTRIRSHIYILCCHSRHTRCVLQI